MKVTLELLLTYQFKREILSIIDHVKIASPVAPAVQFQPWIAHL